MRFRPGNRVTVKGKYSPYTDYGSGTVQGMDYDRVIVDLDNNPFGFVPCFYKDEVKHIDSIGDNNEIDDTAVDSNDL